MFKHFKKQIFENVPLICENILKIFNKNYEVGSAPQ